MELDPKFPLPKELVKTLTQHSRDIVLSSTHFLFLYILRSLCSKASASLNNYRVILVCICAMVQSEVLKNQADHELCFPLMCSAEGELQFDLGIATQPFYHFFLPSIFIEYHNMPSTAWEKTVHQKHTMSFLLRSLSSIPRFAQKNGFSP